jgi:hypothetical protein
MQRNAFSVNGPLSSDTRCHPAAATTICERLTLIYQICELYKRNIVSRIDRYTG